jgi:hypothetical protein
MKKYASLLVGILAVLLIVLTLPIYVTFCGLSFMAFDSPGGGFFPWMLVGGTLLISLLSVFGSLVGSLLLIRRKKIWWGLGVSIIPLIVLAIFWTWVNTQSFS